MKHNCYSDTPDEDRKLYSFKMEEEAFINGLKKGIRLLLTRPTMSPREIHSCAVLLRALERMPVVWRETAIELSLTQRQDDGSSGWLTVNVSEHSVSFSVGESIASPQGSDTDHRDVAEFGVGWRSDNIDFVEMDDWIIEFNRRASDPTYELLLDNDDYDDIDWSNESTGEQLWELLDSGN